MTSRAMTWNVQDSGKGALARLKGQGRALPAAHLYFDEFESAVAGVRDLMAVARVEVCPLPWLVELERHATAAKPLAGRVLKNHDRRLVLMRRRLLTRRPDDAISAKPLVAGDRLVGEAGLRLGDGFTPAGRFITHHLGADRPRPVIAKAGRVRLLRVTAIAHETGAASDRSTRGRRGSGRRHGSRRWRTARSGGRPTSAPSCAPLFVEILTHRWRVRRRQVIDGPLVCVEPRDVAGRNL